ncbi:MAG: EAL domain-containing protein [Eubacterium sp.]|nr:EAL domain-containing protein [Eubacterium sp.]
MQTVNEFHIAFDIAALVISISVLVFTIIQKRTEKLQNRLFIAMILLISANSIVSVTASFAELFETTSESARYVIYVSEYLYFALHTGLCPLLYFYVTSVTGATRRRGAVKALAYSVPFFITELFALTNPFFHYVYYYDDMMVFHRNWAEYLIYAAAALYFALAVEELFFAWNAINARRRLSLMYFFMLAIVGVVIQLIYKDIKSELFAEALAVMGAMLLIENEDDKIDTDTGIYNRHALQMDLHNFLQLRIVTPLIFVKITNTNMIERVTQSANHDILSELGSEYLKTLVKRHMIYHPNPETFVIACNNYSEEQIETLIDTINERFSKGWNFNGISFMLEASVISASIPGQLKTIEDVFYVADSIIPAGVSKNGADIDWIMRKNEVESAVRRSVSDGNLEVYYQPTYSLRDKKLHGAEALARMKDSKIGMISPDEFIPVAEQNGMVEEIDDYVLREVCKFIEGGEAKESGLKAINVNLSVVQCLRPGFYDHIINIINSYNISHDSLNFEITESVEAEDYDRLSKVVSKLKAEGFSMYMDDYGTGFSNMEAIFSLDYDVVKIDKSILWSAERDTCGKTILENSIRMIHDLEKKVLVEGVETNEQVEMLERLGVDYLQGYLFSRPLPKKDFIKKISY